MNLMQIILTQENRMKEYREKKNSASLYTCLFASASALVFCCIRKVLTFLDNKKRFAQRCVL